MSIAIFKNLSRLFDFSFKKIQWDVKICPTVSFFLLYASYKPRSVLTRNLGGCCQTRKACFSCSCRLFFRCCRRRFDLAASCTFRWCYRKFILRRCACARILLRHIRFRAVRVRRRCRCRYRFWLFIRHRLCSCQHFLR